MKLINLALLTTFWTSLKAYLSSHFRDKTSQIPMDDINLTYATEEDITSLFSD